MQIASDLHHELGISGSPMSKPVALADGNVDVPVLAGDVHKGLAGIELYADYPIPAAYVCGNHEFYDSEMATLLPDMRRRVMGTSVQLLEKDEFVLQDVRFLDTCLWTDYCAFPLALNESMEFAGTHLLDHRRIRKPNHGRFEPEPEDAVAEQREALGFVVRKIREPFAGRTVVVTHHAPSASSVRPCEQKNPLVPAFASNLEYLDSEADVWIHGLLASFPS